MRSWDSIFKVICLGLFSWVVGVFLGDGLFLFCFFFLKHDLKFFFSSCSDKSNLYKYIKVSQFCSGLQ